MNDVLEVTEIDEVELTTFLDSLRDSGATNMMGATPYIEEEFNVNRREARDLLMWWMRASRT